MKSEEKLNKLVDYIGVLKDYYTSVIAEENEDYKKTLIKAKLDVLDDIGKRLKKLEIKN